MVLLTGYDDFYGGNITTIRFYNAIVQYFWITYKYEVRCSKI